MKWNTARQRTTIALAAALAAGLAATGCASTTPAPAGPVPASGAFPVTIDTAYGELTVEEKPEKILVLATSYIDLLDILGEPVYAWNTGFDDSASFVEWYPWLEGSVDGEPDTSLYTADYATSPEAVAALDPDLILTDVWNIDEGLYAQLSQVAPTYTGIETDAQTSWQDNLAALAALTGHDGAIVDEVESSLDDSLADAADRLPGLQGATYQVPVYADDVFTLSEYANDVLESIGLIRGPGQPDVGETGDTGSISLENIDELDAEVVLFATRPYGDDARAELYETLKEDPRLAGLPASSENGALIYLTASEWTAVNGSTPASTRYFLDEVVPRFEESSLNRNAR